MLTAANGRVNALMITAAAPPKVVDSLISFDQTVTCLPILMYRSVTVLSAVNGLVLAKVVE